MYISDSLNLLMNTIIQIATQGKGETFDMRYSDIVSPKPKEAKKQETAEEVIDRMTKKLQGGKG